MKESNIRIAKFVSCFVLALIAYIPTIAWMVDRWMAKESYYGHGFLIPIVSLYIVWQRRGDLAKTTMSSSWTGLAMIVAGLAIHIVCAALKVYFISGFSLIIVLYGLILYFFGTGVGRKLIFPILFLATMVPLPLVLIGNLTVKLKLFVAQVATFILNQIGFPSVRDGNIIRMPGSVLVVEAPCSGLRSLISLLTLGLLFAYAAKMSYVRKTALFLSSVPIALASNMARIIALGVVNDLYGEKIAMGFFHDFMGFFVFVFAFFGLMGMNRILEGHRRETI